MLLPGRDIAAYIKQRHFEQVRQMKRPPKLAILQSGTDAATENYLKIKRRYGQDIGVEVEIYPAGKSDADVLEVLKKLNRDQSVDGIIVQLPLPAAIDTERVIAAIEPSKDVDGLTLNSPFDPATPLGILWLLGGHQIDLKGKTVVVVGKGRLVGTPLLGLLESAGARVISCDRTTKDLAAKTLKADILVSATGQPGLIVPGMVKPGTVIVDAGSGEAGGKVSGDVDPAMLDDDSLKITPNPGGVGPMTVAALYDNLIRAAQRQN